MGCEFTEDVCGGAGQGLTQTAPRAFGPPGGNEDEPMGLDRSLAGGATQVGQSHHATHGMSGERERSCDVEGYEQVGEVGGEPVDVVGVHRCSPGVAMAAVVVADDPDAVAGVAAQVTD